MSGITRRHRLATIGVLIAATLLLTCCSSSSSGSEKSLPPSLTAASTVPAPVTLAATIPATTTTVAATTTTTTLAPTAAPTSPTAPAPTTPTTAATVLELQGNGVGLSSFQADPDQSIQYLSTILGAPTSDSGWVDAATSPFGICAGKDVRGVRWGDLLLLYGDLAAADGVRAFFGYTFGAPGVTSTGKPAGLRTAKGITLGSTVAELRAAYPDVTITDATPATFDLPSLPLGGTISDVSQAGLVTSIYGGDGCESQ